MPLDIELQTRALEDAEAEPKRLDAILLQERELLQFRAEILRGMIRLTKLYLGPEVAS